MGHPADIDFGNAQLIGGFAHIYEGSWLDTGNAATNNQSGNKNIGGIGRFYRHLNCRIFTGYGFDPGINYAFALNSDEHIGFAEGHPHLKDGLFSRGIAFLFRQQINAVVITDIKPPFAFIGNPDISVGVCFVACLIH